MQTSFACVGNLAFPNPCTGAFLPLRPRPTLRGLDAGNLSRFHHDKGRRPPPLDSVPTVRRLDTRQGFRALHLDGGKSPATPQDVVDVLTATHYAYLHVRFFRESGR
jgi:hypothetical protein